MASLLAACPLLLAASSAFADIAADRRSVAACANLDCLREIAPRERMTWLTEKACAPLAGKTDPGNFNEDLSVLCNLVIARAKASFRKRWPCSNEGSDWAMGLEGKLALPFFNEALYLNLPRKVRPVALLPTDFAANNSTLHSTYVYDRQFSLRTQSGTEQQVSFATYFCITGTGDKRAYAPYFDVLKVDGKPRHTEYLETPPFAENPVFTQIGRWGFDSAKALQLVDIDGDGLKDFLAVENDMMKESYAPRACLANGSGGPCTEVKAGDGLVFKEMFARASIRLVSPKLVEVQVTSTASTPGAKATSSSRFALQGKSFVRQ